MKQQGLGRPSRQLVTQQDAALIERADIPRSTFHNQWTHKTTFNAADLVPIYLMEVFPGDHVNVSMHAYIRMSTPLFPLMDNQRFDSSWWYCPSRILWDHFVNMMGEQANPGDTIAYTFPTMLSPAGGFAINSIYDHLGLPTVGQMTAGQTIPVNTLPLRMYNRIFNDWYRDQNLMGSLVVRKTDTGDLITDFSMQKRCKQHDRFTKALPWTQKFTAPTVPLTGLAPVIGLGIQTADRGASATNATFFESDANAAGRLFPFYKNSPGTLFVEYSANTGAFPMIFAKLDNATGGVSINTLRNAWAIQQLLERDARGGSRYIEHVEAQWGVNIPDYRLQRPEYIGGGSTPLNITPIAQTTPTGGNGLGALGGAGVAAGTHSASYAAVEHGYIMCLANIRTELSYYQGLHRLWSRTDRYSLPVPALMGLGEQAILNKELYCTGVDATDDAVFGYEPRWDELREEYNQVTGLFRGTSAGTIDPWHLAQKFTAQPTLGSAFITDSTDTTMDRVLAAGAAAQQMQFLAIFHFQRTATRAISLYGTPANLTRF